MQSSPEDPPCPRCIGMVGAGPDIPMHQSLFSWAHEAAGDGRVRCATCGLYWELKDEGWTRAG